MRIISYNILDGGLGRADPIAEVLLAQRPDIVGLVEADNAEVLDRIAWRLSFDYVAAEGREGRTAALLTRGDIVESMNHAARLGEPGPRSFLEATIELAGVALPLAVIHTTAGANEKDESQRQREVAEVLRVFADARQSGVAHVLLGDFNANSPVQMIERDRLPEMSKKAFDDNGGNLPRRVVQTILDAGYADAFAVARPEAAKAQGSFTTRQPGQRVDYVFTHGIDLARVVAGWIETDRLATFASDHYPVGVELRLP